MRCGGSEVKTIKVSGGRTGAPQVGQQAGRWGGCHPLPQCGSLHEPQAAHARADCGAAHPQVLCKRQEAPPAPSQVKDALFEVHGLDKSMANTVFLNLNDSCVYEMGTTSCLTSHRSDFQADRLMCRLFLDIGLIMVRGRLDGGRGREASQGIALSEAGSGGSGAPPACLGPALGHAGVQGKLLGSAVPSAAPRGCLPTLCTRPALPSHATPAPYSSRTGSTSWLGWQPWARPWAWSCWWAGSGGRPSTSSVHPGRPPCSWPTLRSEWCCWLAGRRAGGLEWSEMGRRGSGLPWLAGWQSGSLARG